MEVVNHVQKNKNLVERKRQRIKKSFPTFRL
jgi:hypothetical protein